VSSTREKKKYKGKTPEEQCKVQKWIRANKGHAKRLPYRVPIDERMIDKTPKEEWWHKYKRNLNAIKRTNKGEKLGQLPLDTQNS
jgi:RNA:NAD 2'-phosphotransferase (TPT1/KptA family)